MAPPACPELPELPELAGRQQAQPASGAGVCATGAAEPHPRTCWHPRWGDRAQALVFIGQGLRGAAAQALTAALEWCVLSDAEVALGEAEWAAWDDSQWLSLLEEL